MLDVEVFEVAGAAVAHDHIGLVGIAAEIAGAEHLPVSPDIADRAGADDLVVLDVEVIEVAGVAVAHDHIGFVGVAAEIADAEDLPVGPMLPIEPAPAIWLCWM